MIAPISNSLCREAELYYYDLLRNESRGLIPESIINHTKQCQHCQAQINRLKEVLSQAEGHIESGQKQLSFASAVMLELHFAYIGKPVTCETVRPFLPSLLDPALEIRTPTPITAHLDNCQQCSEDLETIRGLNLSRKQLRRLSQLFAEKPGEENISCSQAQAAVLAVVSMAFRETNTEVLKHLCICHDCRKLLYQYRETVREGLVTDKRAPEKFLCEEVSETDIFDYVVPYGLDPTRDKYAKFRESLTSHLRTCPTCLAKMQQLHNTAYAIAERAESEVVTIFHIDESAKAKAISGSKDLYAGFPIRVEVTECEEKVKTEQPAPAIQFDTALEQKVSAKKLKPLLKTGIAAAAVILIGVTLLLNIPAARAVTLGQIYKAIEKVKNVYISSFVPDQEEPIQEQWVSRTLNFYMLKTGEELILWDLSNKVRNTKKLGADAVETEHLSDGVMAEIEKKIAGSLDLMPFYDISEVPKDAEWSRVDNENVEVAEGIEVYDLSWTEKAYDGSIVFKKWRVFADAKTNLPRRTKFYRKLAADNEYTLMSMMMIEYLTDSEIQTVIEDASF